MSKNLKRAALTVIGAVTAAGLLLPATAQAATGPAPAPAPAASQQAGATASGYYRTEIFVDAMGRIGELIGSVLSDLIMEKQRPEFVHRQLDETMKAYPAHNVMIINDKLDYSLDLRGVVANARVTQGSATYRVLAFTSGTIVNRGDGGWSNWGFGGWFTRNGNSVTFTG
ncbi:hypothetical protein GCM10010371_09780 [Streptomyces subrutilus]|uniref:Stress protein n=1 Tax=Streptomyces subrutilus TaxID=36818 RepID=A0A5P2UIR0_9ACTN|nr:hypothetical protein [Streptomyces subrutilus]QEU79166.1 hypothetical protein CP968_13360 [Streptomyces subrutilus]GGZ52371.1 hypothetical protein GCM10010371_09780 [Streptomyces subrutilus]